MFRDYMTLSFNSLRRRKLRSWLTMIGIFIGIASVVALMGLGEGLRNAILTQFNSLGPDFLTIQAGGVQFGPPGTGVITPLTDNLVDKLENVNGVEIVIPRLIKTGSMEFNNIVAYGYAASIPDGNKRREIERLLAAKPESGRLLKDGDNLKVVLGNNFASADIFGKPIKVGDSVLLNNKKFDVVGILKKQGSFMVDSIVLMNEAPLKDLFDVDDEVSMIAVKADKSADMNSVKESLEKVLRKERNVKKGEEDFEVSLAADTLDTVDSTLFAVQLFVSIIASISLIVGGIGITNTMYTAVIERTKEIGVMKSIGAKNIDIFMLFFIESGLLGSAGGIIGIILGYSLAKGMAFAGALALGSDLIQAHISIYLVVGALLFSFVVGCVAGITPALRASKLHPVDALRYSK